MRFRKKPIVVEAWQWDGRTNIVDVPSWIRDAKGVTISNLYPDSICRVQIWTLEGTMQTDPGDWIIKGVKGELYPIKNEIFIETYEPVAEESK